MAVVSTAAVVLHAFPYGESSKIVRLATQQHGVLSAIAKGAQREKSRFGARLQIMSDGIAQIYLKQNRDLHTLAEFDIQHQRVGLALDVSRYASAAALAELVLRFSPEEPQPQIYELLTAQLDILTEVDSGRLAEASLGAIWRVVCALGFTPALAECAADGRAIDGGGVDFSVADGGYVCPSCAASRETARLEQDDRLWLEMFVLGKEGVESPPPPRRALSRRHAAAHRRLLSLFVKLHVAEGGGGRELKALQFWETWPWRGTP